MKLLAVIFFIVLAIALGLLFLAYLAWRAFIGLVELVDHFRGWFCFLLCALCVLCVRQSSAQDNTPLPPTNSIDMGWSPSTSPDVVGYDLYAGTVSGVYTNEVSVPGSVTNYDFTGLDPATTYYFAARAVNSNGIESALSPEVSASTPAPVVSVAFSPDLKSWSPIWFTNMQPGYYRLGYQK